MSHSAYKVHLTSKNEIPFHIVYLLIQNVTFHFVHLVELSFDNTQGKF